MATEGEPSSYVKIIQLFVLSTAWGMQIWVTFISGFVLFRGVSRHTFGLVQSKLFPFYFYTLLGCTFLNLVIFASYHRGSFSAPGIQSRLCPFLLASFWQLPMLPGSPKSPPRPCSRCRRLKGSMASGTRWGCRSAGAYQLLKEKDAKYQNLRQKFFKFHGLSSLCNLAGVFCTGVNLACLALQLDSL